MLTTSDAAKRLGITRQRIVALIHAKRLPAVRFGRAWAIRERDLDAIRERKPGNPKHRR